MDAERIRIVVDHLRQPEPPVPRKQPWEFPLHDHCGLYFRYNWDEAKEYKAVFQELESVEEALATLSSLDSESDGEDFESESEHFESASEHSVIDLCDSDSDVEFQYQRKKDKRPPSHRQIIQFLRSSLQSELEGVEGYLNEGDNPRGSVYWPDWDMMARQRLAEEALEVGPVAISRTIDTAATFDEAWAENDFEKVVELASRNIEDLFNALARRELEAVQQLCKNLRRRFKAYQALRLFSLAVVDANRAFELLTEFDVDLDDARPRPAQQAEQRIVKRESDAESATRANKRRRRVTDQSAVPTPPPPTLTPPAAAPPALVNLPTNLLLLVADHNDPLGQLLPQVQKNT